MRIKHEITFEKGIDSSENIKYIRIANTELIIGLKTPLFLLLASGSLRYYLVGSSLFKQFKVILKCLLQIIVFDKFYWHIRGFHSIN